MTEKQPLNFAAALAGWTVPGLGHVLIGHRKRGLIVGATILCLWLGGLAIGGVSSISIERVNNQLALRQSLWFLGQVWVGPSLLVQSFNHRLKTTADPVPDPDGWAYRPSLGHAREQAVLWTTVAGLLNLMAILDVLMREEKSDEEEEAEPASAEGGGP